MIATWIPFAAMQLGAVRALTDTRLLQTGQQPEMSSPSAYQCLFCNHLNPVGASFCNECGSQLQLQQCDLCGSINKRSARVCYKCGAAFTFASPVGASSAILDHLTSPATLDPVHTTLPETLVEALGARRADVERSSVRGGLLKSEVENVPDVDSGVTIDSLRSSALSAGGGLSSAVAIPATGGFNYRQPIVLVALLLVLVMAAAFFMPDASRPGSPVPPGGGGTQAGGDSAPTRTPPSPAAAASAAAAGAESNEVRGDSAAHRAPAAKACEPAVAALGLCDGAPAEEKK